MAEALQLAAVDLGASSGRVVRGRLVSDRVELEVVHRFDNVPLWLPDGLHWNLGSLLAETLHGLAAAAAGPGGELASVGVDAWGCDYALLDGRGHILGLPFHYRDGRTSMDLLARVHGRMSRSKLYRITGIQTLPFNTIFQLSAEARGAAASVAERIALIPDLFGLWLTGTLANELTAASTTGLLDARERSWALWVVESLGLPRRPFAGEVVPSGTRLGSVLPGHLAAGRAAGAPVHTVGGHDTASAFAAAPITGPHCAILSSGTWSLLGLEVDEPVLGSEAEAGNFTNEQGVGGTVRLLRNVMGLWLVQECRRAWSEAGGGPAYEELAEVAARARPDAALFDPDHPSLLAPGTDMPARIGAACAAVGQPAPADRAGLLRSILLSLACKYRLVLEELQLVSGRRIETIHVVGGGVHNTLLCRLTAEICRREVLAGPAEATALGNVLVQGLALGELADLVQIRELAARSTALTRYEPGAAEVAEETYHRFLTVTGLDAGRPSVPLLS